MKELKNRITKTYKYDDDFCIDIVTYNRVDGTKLYEAYIYHDDYGVKDLMFGMESNQVTSKEFLSLAEANAPEYIEDYKEEYRI